MTETAKKIAGARRTASVCALLAAGTLALAATGPALAGSPGAEAGHGGGTAGARADGPNVLRLQTDYARQFPTERPVGSIVIGNPTIADVSVRDDSYLFLHGRSPGRTNLLVYDQQGGLIGDYLVLVTSSQEYVRLQRGPAARTHYACEPRCEQVLAGDTSDEALANRAGALGTLFSTIDGRADRSAASGNATVDE
ncbi:pilus assembly protein N-terminal domain-containing protein [Futiania mangrovi]|uniref:Pilus assembly protein N-terminal domain-containing protein n=1 Tax=Futiania mangrovi TaxID=2959716 RepID=A0A9J6PLE6_9PROT|nr:pilus assembly protein N-terminal domain-containing protein [Futiania mangrovii]MCP1336866.1 pilus assembly protein N-terminal domain-containing protein [Futiania mangrovii]